MPLYAPPTQNALQKTLGAALNSAVTASATLNNVDGLANLPGIMVVDRVDTSGNETTSKREYIAYTGISGSTVTGLTRNVDSGSTDQDHSVGAIVEFIPDVVWADSIYDALANLVNTTSLVVDTSKVVTPTGTQTLTNKTLTSPTINDPVLTYNGWTATGETWTYASSDDPTYTLTISGDKTSKYSAGMRVKLTDSGTQYFIITKVAYASPNTTLTLYGGTDYDLSTGAITNPYYSIVKAPLSFPLDPDKWTVEVSNESTSSQANALQDVWYNLGGSIDIPLGVWNVEYFVSCKVNNEQGNVLLPIVVTLSTANDSESDSELTSYYGHRGSPSTDTALETITTNTRSKILNLSTKDTYYLNLSQSITTVDLLAVRGDYSATVIRARCAYL